MASAQSQAAVIGLRAYSSDGLDLLKKALTVVAKSISVAEVSSVYRIQSETERADHVHDLRIHNVFHGFVMAARGFTHLTAEQLSERLVEVAEELRSEALRQRVSVELFFLGDTVMMTPELTLPHPEFHLRADGLIPAAEICPDLVHPVLHKTLKSLAAPLARGSWGEFVAQGKAMLDF